MGWKALFQALLFPFVKAAEAYCVPCLKGVFGRCRELIGLKCTEFSEEHEQAGGDGSIGTSMKTQLQPFRTKPRISHN